MLTTIQVKKSTLKKLKDFKQHPRQSYDEAINELMKDNEVEILTMEEIAEIKEGLEQVKRGETYTLEEVAKKYGIKLKNVQAHTSKKR